MPSDATSVSLLTISRYSSAAQQVDAISSNTIFDLVLLQPYSFFINIHCNYPNPLISFKIGVKYYGHVTIMEYNVGLSPQSDSSNVMKVRNFLKQTRKYQLPKSAVQLRIDGK